ncbi:MAG: S8 family serine peptidase, partial [Halobacteriaceae archaeon]
IVPLERLANLNTTTGVIPNFEVSALDVATTTSGGMAGDVTAASHVNTTYGLAQINATKVWQKFGSRGGGIDVAVLDTGVDPDHPDIKGKLEKFAAFEPDGDRKQGARPHDTNGHGTHVSATVVGGNASGEYIGVAPNADLYHGLVLPDGSGTFAQVLAGMQWAVQSDAEVISMSLGADGYVGAFIDPIRNAERAGVVVVAAIGNSGEGTSGSPGNIYDTLSVGASNINRNIASFSSGEEINTSQAWGSAAPDDWPDTYIVPDIAAPGVRVKSAVPGGGYAEFSGTSMATPHVAGTVALMLSVVENNPSPEMVMKALKQTATRPAGANATRYGQGIIDAFAATKALVANDNVSARLADQPRHVQPTKNGTIQFRTSNVQNVTVTLDVMRKPSGATFKRSAVTVYIEGKAASLGETVSVSDGSTD